MYVACNLRQVIRQFVYCRIKRVGRGWIASKLHLTSMQHFVIEADVEIEITIHNV